jgi:hypothetical protein
LVRSLRRASPSLAASSFVTLELQGRIDDAGGYRCAERPVIQTRMPKWATLNLPK